MWNPYQLQQLQFYFRLKGTLKQMLPALDLAISIIILIHCKSWNISLESWRRNHYDHRQTYSKLVYISIWAIQHSFSYIWSRYRKVIFLFKMNSQSFPYIRSIFAPTSTSTYTWGDLKSQWAYPTISDRKIK